MTFRLYSFVSLCLFYTSVTHSTEYQKTFTSCQDVAIGTGMMLLLTVAHESGHALANYFTGGELLEMNIGSQSSGRFNERQKSYASWGKIRLTGISPFSGHVKMTRFHINKKVSMKKEMITDYAGPLMGIIASAVSLYGLNKYGLQDDYRTVKSVCLANLICNIMQLLPLKLFGFQQDGANAYATYKKLKNFKHNTCEFGFYPTKIVENTDCVLTSRLW